MDQTLHRVATKEKEEIERTTKQKMTRRHNREGLLRSLHRWRDDYSDCVFCEHVTVACFSFVGVVDSAKQS